MTNAQLSFPLHRSVSGLLVPVVAVLWAEAIKEPEHWGGFVHAWCEMRGVMERLGSAESFDLTARERESMIAAFAMVPESATVARENIEKINVICGECYA